MREQDAGVCLWYTYGISDIGYHRGRGCNPWQYVFLGGAVIGAADGVGGADRADGARSMEMGLERGSLGLGRRK